MNRRQYKRSAIDHPGIIFLEENTRTQCQIKNFSTGGLFLQCKRIDHPKATQAFNTTIEIPRPGKGDNSPISAPVKIAFISPEGMGVAFLRPEIDLLNYLLSSHKKNLQSEVQLSGVAGGQTKSDISSVISQVSEQAKKFIEEQYPDFFRQAQDELLKAADQAKKNTEQSDFFYALTAIENNQKTIKQACLEQLDQMLENLSGKSNTPPARSQQFDLDGEIELVDQDEFNEWVMVVAAARSIESAASSSLHHIDEAFTFLTKAPIREESNPVSPHALMRSLQKSLEPLGIKPKAKNIIFNAYRDSLTSSFKIFHDSLSNYLSESGIKPSEGSNKTVYRVDSGPVAGDNREQSVRRKKTIVESLSSFMPFSHSDSKEASQRPIASNQAVINSLDASPYSTSESIIPQIERQLYRQSGRAVALSPEVRARIDASQQLLDSLQEEQQPGSRMEQFINSLGSSFIKEAISDPALLEKADHPGRKLLASIDNLAPYCQESDLNTVDKNTLFSTLSQIEDSAFMEGKLDLSKATRQIETLLARQKENFEKNLALVIDSTQQDEALNQIEKDVLDLLLKKLSRDSVSTVLDRLLQTGWANLLVLTLLRRGKRSKEWELYIGVIDFLQKAFAKERQPRAIGKEKTEHLIRALHKGFSDYPIRPEETELLVTELEDALINGGDNYKRFLADRLVIDKAYLLKLLLNQMPFKSGAETLTATPAKQKWLNLVSEIDIDDWITEQRDQSQVRLINLAWKKSDRYVFVDGDGIKALDISASKLASLFQENKYSLLENKQLPLIDRAINRALKKTYNQIKKESDADELTGVMSRKAFERELAAALQLSHDEGSLHTLISLDIDKFSMVNEICGFEGGDQLLQKVVSIIKTYMPPESMLARTGDDEFCLLICHSTIDKAYQVAETNRGAIENFKFTWNELSVHVTTSIGIVAIDDTSNSPTELLKNVSSASKIAKEAGRNCARIYQSHNREMEKQRRLVKSVPFIEQALENNRLALYTQLITPIFLGEGDKEHYEVLLRTIDENGKPGPPSEFIQAAEQYNRILSVDRWVIESFFSWIGNNSDKIDDIGGFSINLSGQSLINRKLVETIKRKIIECPIPADKIGLEITETALVKNIDRAIVLIHELKELGCKFYLDDFGTGYSSYSYLKDLPVDFVKIDGVFVKDITKDKTSYAMVKSITDIAHQMGKKVIAEYVENEAILIALRKLEVDFAQGYGVGHPSPIQSLVR